MLISQNLFPTKDLFAYLFLESDDDNGDYYDENDEYDDDVYDYENP